MAISESRKDKALGREPSGYDESAYSTWTNDKERAIAIRESSRCLEEYVGISRAEEMEGRSSAFLWRDFSNLQPGISGRPGLTKRDWRFFRPNEVPPVEYKRIIQAADFYYYTVGIIRNTIDLMGDFCTRGIRIVHPNKKIEKFHRNWWDRINGQMVSERFSNYLFRTGNVTMKVQTATINDMDKDKIQKGVASGEFDSQFTLKPNEIPWKYNFLHPAMIEVMGGPLASFAGGPKQYALNMTTNLRSVVNAPRTAQERSVVSSLPDDIKLAAKSNLLVPLPPDKTLVYHYKKDDWQTWAYPLIYAVMDDIIMLEKLRLADMAALDGAISHIRIFKLGNVEKKLAPKPAAAQKLASILQSHVGGGTIDIVWGEDIELIESNSDVYQFLGEGKYTPHLNAIYAGLGIPQTLTGSSSGGKGTTNNYISLKTMIERLEYGRTILKRMWDTQLAAIQKSMGFRFPAKIEFEKVTLDDGDTEKRILLELSDRGLISDELLQIKMGSDPDMEKIRINRENRDRNEGRMTPKVGPFFGAPIIDQLKKIALQTMVAAPSQVGLELDPKKSGEQSGLTMKAKQTPASPFGGPPKGKPGQGRPSGTNDKTKRKPKKFTPRVKAALAVWAKNAQEFISENLNDLFLEKFAKANFRQLSTEEADMVENVKFGVLLAMEPMSKLTVDNLELALAQDIRTEALTVDLTRVFIENFDYQPTFADLRELQKSYYISKCELESEGEDNGDDSLRD